MNKTIYDILNKIESNGFKAYIVGGYVRDFLRKIKSYDVDICTNARPKDLVTIFENYNLTILEYGNVILHTKEYDFEMTTFRKDIKYKNNRKPIEIKYIDSLDEDLLRRDFTINSICMTKEGKIIDLLNAKKDLSKKVIKCIGNAEIKIKEDSLRIMRAIRFATVLKFKLDENLIIAIKNNKELLKTLSYERKREELNKIFMSENKAYGIKLLKDLGLLDVLELTNINNVLLTKDLIGMWSTITISNNYPFTKNEKELIKNINCLMKDDITNKFVLYKYGLYTISIVCDLKKLSKRKYTNKYNKLSIKDRNEIRITGEQICDVLNKQPDSFLKDIYADLEFNILDKKLKNNEDAIKKYIIEKYSMV